MAAVGTIVAAAVAAVGAIVGAIISSSSKNKAQRESKELMEFQIDLKAHEIKRQDLRTKQVDLFKQQQIDTQAENLAEEKQFRERDRSAQLNRQQIQDTLGLINQSHQQRQQFQGLFDDRRFR